MNPFADSAVRCTATVEPPWDVDAWRAQARMALAAGMPPAAIDWHGGAQGSLIAGTPLSALPTMHDVPTVPRDFLELAARVVCHRDPDRHALLYRMLWRIAHGERHLATLAIDPDTHRARQLDQAVRRDTHKMKAFVRFRAVPGCENTFIAWFEPEHHIVDRVSGFFARRFAGMRWSILTPDRSVHWDGQALAFGAGALRADAPADDAQETLWRTYYAHIFNPARLNPRMMRQEMPQKYWKHLPEAALLPTLVRDAGARVADMQARAAEAPRRRIPAPPAAVPPAPATDLAALQEQVVACRACPLWAPATQAVPGMGPRDARVVLVGEQPGDAEDLSGRPFVGPAGQLLRAVLDDIGVDPDALYLTNAVKHFGFEQRGRHRLHRTPEPGHQRACRTWLHRELALVQARVVVCLGATAARNVLGREVALLRERGEWIEGADGSRVLVTVHPAWVLRQPTARREQARALLRQDLSRACTGAALP